MNSTDIDRAVAFLIRVGVVVSGIIAITVVAVPIVAPMVSTTYRIPDQIGEWGGVIIGFYFGSFITLLANLLRRDGGGVTSAKEKGDMSGNGQPQSAQR